MGGVVINTPIHAFEVPPLVLTLKWKNTLTSKRKNIDLGGLLAFSVEDVITSEEAN